MTRFRVAYLCVDSEGNWSVDMPGYEQGGSVGFGTVTPYPPTFQSAVGLIESIPESVQE